MSLRGESWLPGEKCSCCSARINPHQAGAALVQSAWCPDTARGGVFPWQQHYIYQSESAVTVTVTESESESASPIQPQSREDRLEL